VPSGLSRQGLDTGSVHSVASKNVIAYKRPFVSLSNPSLSDIRSWHDSLSTRESAGSSGNPGLGYISGLILKRASEKMLGLFMPLEIRRRLWVMGRLIKRMEKEQDNSSKWLEKRKRALNRLVDDVLELSSYGSYLPSRNLSLTPLLSVIATRRDIKVNLRRMQTA
jgi:hypothetical protein